MNVTFNGNIYYENNTLAINVAYRLYFKSNNTGSSTSSWSNIRYTESNLHQYNINLLDPDVIGNQGSYNIGDEVLLLFWIPMSSTHTDSNLIEYSAIHYILDGSQTYPQDVQLLSHQHPTCSFSSSGSYNVNEIISVIDTGSTDNYYWMFSNKQHFQECSRYNQQLFNKNCIPNGSIEINWGDGTIDSNLNIVDSPFNHSYTTIGDYDIYITLYNSDMLECIYHITAHIIYNVNNGLTWTEPVYLNQSKEYIPNITGDVQRISKVDYHIDGILTYPDLLYTEHFNHTFISPGSHIIRQCISYNDGFNDVVKCEDFTINIGSIAHFFESEYGCGLVFESDSIIGSPPVQNYQWDVIYNNNVISHLEGQTLNRFYYSFPYVGVFRVRLQITDQYNISSYEREYDITECQGSCQDNGGSSGGSSPWVYKEYKENIPVIKIVNITDKDHKKKFLILDIKEIQQT